jgi:4'-phosphopantetheinyl transferase EntD
MRPEVRSLFPDYVAGVELIAAEDCELLFPEEEAHIARAVDKRRVEFALGRTCARRALEQLGIPRGPLLAQQDRSVAWPEAAWGSITHADGYCAAIAALRSDVRGLGIDAEVKTRVHRKLWKQIANESETEWLDQTGDEDSALLRAGMLFSAKESFYKAQFCISRAWVGFHDADLRFDTSGNFDVTLLVDVPNHFAAGDMFSGRYVVLDEHVVTGIVIPA